MTYRQQFYSTLPIVRILRLRWYRRYVPRVMNKIESVSSWSEQKTLHKIALTCVHNQAELSYLVFTSSILILELPLHHKLPQQKHPTNNKDFVHNTPR